MVPLSFEPKRMLVGINGGLKLSHRREASPSNGLGSDSGEETLDHVEPGTASGSEVKVEARVK
jgi:hypothetical protein